MSENIIILECPCSHRWVERLTRLPMAVCAFIARLKGMSVCPICGKSKDVMLLTGERYRQAYKELLGVEAPDD